MHTIIVATKKEKSFEERLLAGNYNQIFRGIIRRRFPIKNETAGEWEVKLFNPKMELTYNEIKFLLDLESVNGWRIVKTEHILAFGEQHPLIQIKFPIVGLNAIGFIKNEVHIMRLYFGCKDRILTANKKEGTWKKETRYLLVRRIKKNFHLPNPDR